MTCWYRKAITLAAFKAVLNPRLPMRAAHWSFAIGVQRRGGSFARHLDPNSGEKIALPPDSELMADLTAPTWFLSTQGIQIEEKDAIRKRLGRSTDAGDAVVMCYNIITRAGNNMVYF